MKRYWAELKDNIVIQVVVSEEKPDGHFVETFINSKKIYAGIGYTYFPELENFCSPQPFESWMLSKDCVWTPPVQIPEEGMHDWDEQNRQWVVVLTNEKNEKIL